PRRPPLVTLFPYTTLFRSLTFFAKNLNGKARALGLSYGQSFVSRGAREGPPTRPDPSLSAGDGAASATHRPRSSFRGPRLRDPRSEEHTSELQSLAYLVCR